MKVDIVRNGNIVKSYETWREGERQEKQDLSFSTQLLMELREKREKVDIRDVRELLELGADPNYKLMGHTSDEEFKKMVDYYEEIESDKYLDIEVFTYCTLSYAIAYQNKRPDVINAMLKFKVDPNLNLEGVRIKSGPTAFFCCATTPMDDVNAHESILDSFVRKGANVKVRDKQGNNPIHICVSKKYFDFDIIPKLIQLGIDPYQRNDDGHTPYDIMNMTSYAARSYRQMEDSEEVKAKKQQYNDILKPPPVETKRGFFGKKSR